MRKPRPRRHPTDLGDAEWAALEPLLPPPARRGRTPEWPCRLVAEAILHLARPGCAWRMLPRCCLPWPTVFAYFRRWRLDGTFRRILVDAAGPVLLAHVRAADLHDRLGAQALVRSAGRGHLPRLELVWGGGAYAAAPRASGPARSRRAGPVRRSALCPCPGSS